MSIPLNITDLTPQRQDGQRTLLAKIVLALISPNLAALIQGAADHAANGQVTALSTGAASLAARDTRRRVAWINLSASETVYAGFTTGVTADNGYPMAPGSSLAASYSGPVFFFSASGTAKIAYFETYD